MDRNGTPGFRGRAGSFLWTARHWLSTVCDWLARVVVGIGCTTHPTAAAARLGVVPGF
jgi:hypothetical protein